MKRLIVLTDGTSMGDEVLVFATDAPVEELKKLEKVSNQIYADGGDDCDVPIWAEVLDEKGYDFEFVGSHPHVSTFGTSNDWLEKNYNTVTERYLIENQPNLH